MKKLQIGEFYGKHYQKSNFENVIVTDTEYTHSRVDWHYHELPYFTYLLQGQLFEANKKESYYLEPGSLLFHNWQDAHYNIKPAVYTRGFHIELDTNWFSNYDIKSQSFEGSIDLKSPVIKSLMSVIYAESKIQDQYSALTVETSLIKIFDTIVNTTEISKKKPIWVNKLQELLLEEDIDYSLKNLSALIGIHPIHLSRSFTNYFGTTLGNYMRCIQLNKAFCLLASKKFSMTEICYRCGFYDQSHFISSFKSIYNRTPTTLLKEIS